ncbi:transglutaminaseTgpA domain-containing protein [Actinomadura sp. 3N508]|uniref:transglutaminaseTgpA domain-containing protein n=1 Tax=Actinomadura sp. 3N508 TaxID=3375153 RepID=UPI003788117D
MRIRMTVMAGLATLAGSIGLYPLFESGSWFGTGLGAVLAVAAAGVLARRLRLPAAVNLLLGVTGLLLYLNLVYASGESWLGVIPSPESVERLGVLAGDGWRAANRYAAPVPVLPGIELLAAAGIGLVAVLVDLLAVRLRRAAPAGLPLLAMYSVPAAVREDGVSWLAFGVGALGFLALLMADAREQVGGWGRTVSSFRQRDVPLAGAASRSGEGSALPDAAALAASGRRIAAGAVAIAVLVPAAVPGLQPRGMFGLGGGGRGGTQTVTTPDPLVSLKRELTQLDESIVLTYRTNDPEAPDYLRLYALDKFEGDRWTYSQLDSHPRDRLDERRLPAPPGLSVASSREVTTRVQVRPEVRDMSFLPVPYAPADVTISGDWRVDERSLMIYSLRDSADGRAYTVRSRRAEPTIGQLAGAGSSPPDIVARYTAVPKNVPREVRQLAEQVTAGSATALSQAVRLQRWFTLSGGFTYDLSAPAPKHGSDLVDFLLHSKRGYCEQFAASMALMARLLSIPSRVAMGYTAGSEVRPGQWVVRSQDAHAWPELYFEGTGWVRFEPTPSGAGGQGTAASPEYSLPETTGGGTDGGESRPEPETSSPAGGQAPAPQSPARGRTDTGETGGAAAQDDEDGGFSAAPWLAGGVLVLLLLAVPMVLRAFTRRRRWAALLAPPGSASRPSRTRTRPGSSPGSRSGRRLGARPGSAAGAGPRVPPPDAAGAAHAAWREMRADALDHGLEWRASDSPRATARRLGELLELDDAGTQALARIARAEELARYSLARSPEPPERLRADVRTVRDAFAASVGPGTRWRARLLPPSTLAQTRAMLQSAGDRALDVRARLYELPARLRRK